MHDFEKRVLSGMRASGRLHLGHYHGVLKNWLALQKQYQCFYFVADWHGLTTHYETPEVIKTSREEMLIDWLAVGLNPQQSTIFVQSQVSQHAELHLLLSMISPLGWLERVPSYKDQITKLKEQDLATYGFLGYPVLQSADILLYRAGKVPVGSDQVAHLEITRKIARRFNSLFGRDQHFKTSLVALQKKLGSSQTAELEKLRKKYLQDGTAQTLQQAKKILRDHNLNHAELAVYYGYLENSGRLILPPCEPLLTKQSKVLGTDGQKMSKSYGNAINLRDTPDDITRKIKRCLTDPQRVRRSDKGNPDNCPVWSLHRLHSDQTTQKWVREGCTSAGIGCVECKAKATEFIVEELRPISARASVIASDRAELKRQVAAGSERASEHAELTLKEVRSAMGI